MTATASIRKATHRDLGEIERLMKAATAVLSRGFYDERQIISATRYIAVPDRLLIDDQTYFVAEEHGRILACGGWSARKKLFTGTAEQASADDWLTTAEPARLRAMFVDPDEARQGLGRQILAASEHAAQQAGFRSCTLMALLPGVPLYTACGYETIQPATIPLPDGVTIAAIHMRKFLHCTGS